MEPMLFMMTKVLERTQMSDNTLKLQTKIPKVFTARDVRCALVCGTHTPSVPFAPPLHIIPKTQLLPASTASVSSDFLAIRVQGRNLRRRGCCKGGPECTGCQRVCRQPDKQDHLDGASNFV